MSLIAHLFKKENSDRLGLNQCRQRVSMLKPEEPPKRQGHTRDSGKARSEARTSKRSEIQASELIKAAGIFGNLCPARSKPVFTEQLESASLVSPGHCDNMLGLSAVNCLVILRHLYSVPVTRTFPALLKHSSYCAQTL